jgi:hypothetical protein
LVRLCAVNSGVVRVVAAEERLGFVSARSSGHASAEGGPWISRASVVGSCRLSPALPIALGFDAAGRDLSQECCPYARAS